MQKILKFDKRRAYNKDEGLEQKSKNNKRRAYIYWLGWKSLQNFC
jgi:hypothetical protein